MIGIKGIGDIYGSHKPTTAQRNSARTEDKAASVVKEGGVKDSVVISPEATFRAKLDGAVKKKAADMQAKSEVSASRIAELKEKYKGDATPVSGIDVSKAILARIRGPVEDLSATEDNI